MYNEFDVRQDFPYKKSKYFVNVALAENEDGSVSLICEAGTFGSEPVCVIFVRAEKRLDIVLASGDVMQMADTVMDSLIPPLEKAKRVLLIEMAEDSTSCGYVIPILHREGFAESQTKLSAMG